MRLELGEDDVARLYGQGLARGALVWKKGMMEWRPLLITPELAGLLRRTRVKVNAPAPAAEPSEPVTAPRLPAPARVPSEFAFSGEPAQHGPLSVSPTAIDVPAPAPPRRRYEIAAVAALSFGLAWFVQGVLSPDAAAPNEAQPVAAAAAAPAASPVAVPLPVTPTPPSTIPMVAVDDLPVVGRRGSTAPASLRRSVTASSSRSSDDGGPSRSALVGALSRVASVASGCGERGGPVRVVVSFASSGVARSIKVSGKDLPAATRSCIIGAASRARIPAFSGDPVTVAKTL